jgi:glycerol-3-phosphate acyltransferase PlsY
VQIQYGSVLVLLIFVGITILTRYVSLGSILAAASAPILMIAFREPFIYIILTFIAAAIVIFRHRTNIRRLLRGTELRFGDRP